MDKPVKPAETPTLDKKLKSSSLCTYCGFRGHTFDVCRLRINAEKRIADAKSESKEIACTATQDYAFIVAHKESASGAELSRESRDQTSFKLGGWLVDSGATSHMSPFYQDFDNYKTTTSAIGLVNGDEIAVLGTGTINVTQDDLKFNLKQVLHVPDIRDRLFSVIKAIDNGHSVHFTPDGS